MRDEPARDIFSRPTPLQAAVRSIPVTIFYLLLSGLIVAALPDRAWNLKTQALVAMSLFGFWRYSWQVLHAIRHWRYRRTVFPQLRDEAMAQEDKYPERLYIMVPSYKEEFQVSQIVFEALIREARTVPSKVLIYASVGSDEEVEFISKVINSTPGGDEIDTIFMHQGQGKRVAMGYALRAIARDFNDPVSWHPDADNDAVIFMDGDTLVEPGTFRKTLPYFRSNSKLGALTTDNLGVSPDGEGVFNDWYSVKFAQRNHIFHSHSLSRRVLTITGRFSVYRARVVVDEEFIRFLEADHLDHWLFGRFRFLMGDDKSTWYYLLKEGMEMLYVPDVTAVALEMRQTRFLRTTLSLMHRWYGNMLRNNWRAIKVGPRPMGGFIWWCIVDQRISSFSPLVGPVSILLLSIFDSWFYLGFYVSWVLLTRLLMMWIYVLEGMRLRSLHIPLVLYNQWVGAVLKIYSMHSLDMQSWHKTGTDTGRAEVGSTGEQRTGRDRKEDNKPGFGFMRGATRVFLLAFNTAMLVMVCGVVSGVFVLPGMSELSYYRTRWEQGRFVSVMNHRDPVVQVVQAGVNGRSINEAIASAAVGEPVKIVLPEGRIVLDEPVRIDRDRVRLVGAGMGRTVLESRLKTEQGAAAILIGGHKGPVVGFMDGSANRGDKVISLAGWPEDARYAWFGAPNDDEFFDAIGDTNWREDAPWIRQFIAEIAGHGKGYIILKQGLPVAFPAGTEVRVARMVTGVELSGFTLTQQVPEASLEEVTGVYENSAPEYAVDGIRFDWAAECETRDVTLHGVGRHPLVFENSRDVRALDMHIDGAWNKGKGGNGYVRFARSFDCELTGSEVRNIRHLAFQWGAAHNRVSNSTLLTDINFHGGYSQSNVVTNTTISPPSTHPWGAVTRMPQGGAAWAPPDGPGNVVGGE